MKQGSKYSALLIQPLYYSHNDTKSSKILSVPTPSPPPDRVLYARKNEGNVEVGTAEVAGNPITIDEACVSTS